MDKWPSLLTNLGSVNKSMGSLQTRHNGIELIKWRFVSAISIIIAGQTNQHRSPVIFHDFLSFPDVRVSLPNEALCHRKIFIHIHMVCTQAERNDEMKIYI